MKVDSFIPDGKTKFCFLFGSNIAHSLSPKLHSTWMQSNKLNSVYLPLQIKEEPEFLSVLKNLTQIEGFLGGNITLPFKNAVLNLNFLKQSETVKKIKAANTIYKNNLNEWCLENTDIKGIEASIITLIKPNVKFEMIVLGGGGAAATVIYWGIMNENCSKIICVTRNPVKTKDNYKYLSNESKFSIVKLDEEHVHNLISEVNHNADKKVLVNTLPLGLLDSPSSGSYADENSYALHFINKLNSKQSCYFDLIYENTQAIHEAKAKGLNCINGKLMLETQAKESFYLWTGIKIKN